MIASSSLSSVVPNPSVLEPTEQVSAADYDPSMDRREDDARIARHAAAALADGTGEIPNQPEVTMEDGDADEIEVTEDEDDLDDMFAIDLDKPKKKKMVKVRFCSIGCATVSLKAPSIL